MGDKRPPGHDLRLESELELDALNIAAAWYCRHPESSLGVIHPCVVDGESALICRSGLSVAEPAAYLDLRRLAQGYGLAVREDRRRRAQRVSRDRRAHLALVIGIGSTALTRSEPAVACDAHGDHVSHPTFSSVMTNLSLQRQSNGALRITHAAPRAMATAYRVPETPAAGSLDVARHAAFIDDQMQRRLVGVVADEAVVRANLRRVAEYYAQHPQVVRLFEQLATLDFVLVQSSAEWRTEAKFSGDSIRRISVFFDLRFGARMRFEANCSANPSCTVAPADALLHELLHVEEMVADPMGLLAESRHGYPHQHEMRVIIRENNLYASMSANDGKPRPLRSQHVAELVSMSCAVCIDN